MDARNTDEKQKVSWTHALRQIVINCYKYHGREDLLPVFSEEDAEVVPHAQGPTVVSSDENGPVPETEVLSRNLFNFSNLNIAFLLFCVLHIEKSSNMLRKLSKK